MNRKTEIIAVLGLMAAFAAVLSYIEAVLPISIGIPGVKLGLANIAVIVTLFLYGSKESFCVNIVRIFVLGLIFGNIFSIVFSITGAVFSNLFMVIAKKSDLFSIIGVSITGGVVHNIAQAAVAVFIINSYSVIYYVPILIIAGLLTGLFIGFVSHFIIKYMKGINIK